MTSHRRHPRVSPLQLAVTTSALALVITAGTTSAVYIPDRPPAAEPTGPVRVWTNGQLTAARADVPAPASDPITAALGEVGR